MLKVFEIKWPDGEKAWVAARSIIHAMIVYCDFTMTDLDDFEGDEEIVEVPRDKWPTMKIEDEEHEKYSHTFEQAMNGQNDPCLIAVSHND